ncbi:8076_t:CDS:2, partial [Scutellospora calospora]
SLNGTTSCDNKIFTIVDPPNTYYVFTDPGTNFTDGTNPDLPTGFNFRFSANNSITNDSSLITASYPTIVFIDTDSITSSNNDNSQLSDALVELGNFYLLSPNQRQIMWLERVRHKDFDSRTKRGVLSVASKAKKSMVNYYGLTTKIQTLNMYSPSTVTSQFISTLEIRNQSNIVTTYAES